MTGSILVTVGLLLDIVGVALLLAGPRVHPRQSILLLEDQGDDVSTLRGWWSRWGWLGLPTVSSGFVLQIFGAWSQHFETTWLLVAVVVTSLATFGFFSWLVRQLPQRD